MNFKHSTSNYFHQILKIQHQGIIKKSNTSCGLYIHTKFSLIHPKSWKWEVWEEDIENKIKRKLNNLTSRCFQIGFLSWCFSNWWWSLKFFIALSQVFHSCPLFLTLFISKFSPNSLSLENCFFYSFFPIFPLSWLPSHHFIHLLENS